MVNLSDSEARIKKLEQQAFFLKTLGGVLVLVGLTFGGFLSYLIGTVNQQHQAIKENRAALDGFPVLIQQRADALTATITSMAEKEVKAASAAERAEIIKSVEELTTKVTALDDRSYTFAPDKPDSLIGKLPTSAESESFEIPPSIPPKAREILVFISCATGPQLKPEKGGVTIYNIYTETNAKRTGFLYTVVGAANNPWAYNSQAFWLPISASLHKLFIEIEDGGGIGGDQSFFQSQVRVIGFRL